MDGFYKEIASLLAPLAPRNDGVGRVRILDGFGKWIATRCYASLAMTMLRRILNDMRNAESNAKIATDSNRSRIQNTECAERSRGELVLCEQALAFAAERKWSKAALAKHN